MRAVSPHQHVTAIVYTGNGASSGVIGVNAARMEFDKDTARLQIHPVYKMLFINEYPLAQTRKPHFKTLMPSAV